MTPWRKRLYQELRKHELQGRVIDLGGDKRSGYHELIQGDKRVEIANIVAETGAEHIFDLEKPFVLPDGSYDGVLCMNILEHIYNHQQFLAECHRIVRPGGTILLAVPFLMQVHPSPHDHFRYTGESLERMFREAGFTSVSVVPIGKGPFTAASHVAHNALAKIPGLATLHHLLCFGLDTLLSVVDRKSTFGVNRYPLGYLVEARS